MSFFYKVTQLFIFILLWAFQEVVGQVVF